MVNDKTKKRVVSWDNMQGEQPTIEECFGCLLTNINMVRHEHGKGTLNRDACGVYLGIIDRCLKDCSQGANFAGKEGLGFVRQYGKEGSPTEQFETWKALIARHMKEKPKIAPDDPIHQKAADNTLKSVNWLLSNFLAKMRGHGYDRESDLAVKLSSDHVGGIKARELIEARIKVGELPEGSLEEELKKSGAGCTGCSAKSLCGGGGEVTEDPAVKTILSDGERIALAEQLGAARQ